MQCTYYPKVTKNRLKFIVFLLYKIYIDLYNIKHKKSFYRKICMMWWRLGKTTYDKAKRLLCEKEKIIRTKKAKYNEQEGLMSIELERTAKNQIELYATFLPSNQEKPYEINIEEETVRDQIIEVFFQQISSNYAWEIRDN